MPHAYLTVLMRNQTELSISVMNQEAIFNPVFVVPMLYQATCLHL